MSLLLTMFPFYLFGNLHCIGMCGPLAMMIGQHRYRYFYFFGRILSFTLAGALAGGAGAILYLFLREFHIPALISFSFGSIILVIGGYSLLGWQYPGYKWIAKQMSKANQTLSLLMLRDQAWSSFLFGFFTIGLPCGQTLIVFSACALSEDMLTGMMNGFMFAVLTSPSLLMAMNAHRVLKKFSQHYNILMGVCALIIGILAMCRGFAEIGIIPHLILNSKSSSWYHFVIY